MTKQKHFFLFRGLIREARHWGDFPALLSKAYPNCLITTIDIPGAGEYFRSPSPLSIKKMVEEMRQVFLTKHTTDHENVLVAISLGGMISAQWLKDFPQDFDKAILLNTSYGGISKVFDRLKPSALLHVLGVPLRKGRAKEAHIIRLVSNNEANFEKTLNLWESIQKDRPVSLPNTIRQLAAGGLFRIGDFVPKLPVLILASTKDRMVSVDCSRDIAKKWKFPIFEHPEAGHDITSDATEWVVQKIQDFIV